MKLNLLRKIGLNLIVVVCIVQYMLSLPLYAYHIREAHERDIPELTDCHYESWHSTYDHIFNYAYCLKNSRQRLEQYWNKFFKKKDGRFVLVVQEHGEIIGLISAGPFKSIKEENFMIPPNLISAEIYKFYIKTAGFEKFYFSIVVSGLFDSIIARYP
jgi:RimJ/RimL family protein N-acetyltransferase